MGLYWLEPSHLVQIAHIIDNNRNQIRSQLLLARPGRCLKLFVSTDIPSSQVNEPAMAVTAVKLDSQRPVGTATTWAATTAVTVDRQRPVGKATAWTAATVVIAATDWAKTGKAIRQNCDYQSLYLHGKIKIYIYMTLLQLKKVEWHTIQFKV